LCAENWNCRAGKSEKSSRLLQPALQEALPHNDSSNSLKVQSDTHNSIRSSENHDFPREQQEQTLSESECDMKPALGWTMLFRKEVRQVERSLANDQQDTRDEIGFLLIQQSFHDRR
jgi:hypothetical protein